MDDGLPADGPEAAVLARLERTVQEQARRIAELETENASLRQAPADRPTAAGYRTTPADRDVLFSAVEKTRMPMIVTDPNQPDDPIIFANRAFQLLSGYDASELVGRNCRFLQGPRTDPAHVAAIREGLAAGRDVTVDLLNYRKDGTSFVNELYISPILDRDGRVLYHFGSQVDITEAKRNVDRLEASEQRQRALFQSAVDFAFIVTDRDGIVTDWNRGAERILGWTTDEILGRTIERVFTPEDVAAGRLREEMEEADDDGSAPDERWHVRKGGERFWASGKLMPLVTDDGERTGFVKMLVDRTEQYVQARDLETSRRDLEASEAKWRGLFEDLQEGFVLGRVIRDEAGRIVDWRYEEVNRAWGDLVGIPSERAAGRTLRELFPGIEDAWVSEFAAVVETGRPISFTRQVGSIGRWYDGVCQPAGADRFTVIFLDVSERVRSQRSQEALLDLATRLREADDVATAMRVASEISGRLLGASRVGFGLVDVDSETVDMQQDWHTDDVDSIAGFYRFRDFGSFIEDLKRGKDVVVFDTHADPRTRAHRASFDAIAVRTLVNLPVMVRGRLVGVTYVHYDEPHVWTDVEADFLRGVADHTQAAVARAQAEERRSVLNRELAHRLKNTLAIIQSIATQTLRLAPDMATARATLTERIGVLSRAHDILITGQRDAASVGDIVAAATSLHDEGGRVRPSGPHVPLGPRASLTLSLILHELSTNAGKYGALSFEDGHVDVVWTVDAANGSGRPRLTFEWREVGGPPVTPPTRRSFGTRLIEMGLSGAASGTSELIYAQDGLRCILTGELTELRAADQEAAE